MSEESWRTRGGSTTTNNTGNNDNSWVRRAGDEGGNWRGGRSDNNGGRSERPKLNLTKRGEAADTPNAVSVVDADDAQEEKKAESTAAAGEQRPNRQRNSERRFREPEVVNSRAAMLGEVAAPRKEELNNNHRRDAHPRDRRTNEGPPPIQNERFAKLALEGREERAIMMEQRNSSRSSNNSNNSNNNNYGPPVVNSRFAAVAADYDRERNDREQLPRGPPPQITNSRFASAAMDYEKERGMMEREREQRGDNNNNSGPPPPVMNSRFASAAMDYEKERGERGEDNNNNNPMSRFDRRRGDDDNNGSIRYGRDAGPPPIPTNSRFAAAMDSDPDYVPAEIRNERARERAMENGNEQRGNDRFGRGDGDNTRGFGGDNHRGGSRYGDNQRGGGRYNSNHNRDANGEIILPRGPSWKEDPSGPSATAEDFPPIKKVSANILAPKKREEETVMPPLQAPLTLPGEDEEAAKARLEKARAEKEERAAKEKAEREAREAEEARLAEEARVREAKALEVEGSLLNEFVSGNKLGKDLKQWCADNAAILPSVEKLVYHLLTEKEQKNPNPECPWAETDQYGAALLSLVQDKGYEQMQVLWAIQKYCDSIGFPKLNDEYVVQSMFRAMYKYDIAEPGAFDEWKEDESDENSRGKMKAVIQTMDWFTWLEEDDEESEEEEEYEEDEE